jgi:hypothetical protein
MRGERLGLLGLQGTLTIHALRAAKAIALAAGRARAGHHRSIDDYLKSAAENVRERSK